MTESPLLWFLNRGTGVVALVLLTVATVLGVLALGGRPGSRVPRFVVQAVHRNVALLGVVTVAVHVVSSVVDEFVDIRWWHAFVPFTGTHERLWLGLGAVAFDLMLVVTLTSLVRHRMQRRSWHALHLSVYPLWLTSVLHGAGMGTDLSAGLWPVTLGCAAAVAAAAAWRVVRPRGADDADPTHDGMTMPLRRIS